MSKLFVELTRMAKLKDFNGTLDARKSILVSEVREHAGLLLGEEFGKYKTLERLSKRMRTFLNLGAVRMSGRKVKWFANE